MRSPMVESLPYITDKENYSDLQVLYSGAGFYIGTMYANGNWASCGSRDSVEYYHTRADAQEALDNGTFTQRMHP